MEEEGYSDVNENDESRTKESKIQEEVTPEFSLMDIRWNRDRKSSLHEGSSKAAKIDLRF